MKQIERSASIFILLVILLFVVSAIRSSEIEGAAAFLTIESMLAGIFLIFFFVRVFVVRVSLLNRLYYGKIWVTVWLAIMIAKFITQVIGFTEFAGYVLVWGMVMTLVRLSIDKLPKESAK